MRFPWERRRDQSHSWHQDTQQACQGAMTGPFKAGRENLPRLSDSQQFAPHWVSAPIRRLRARDNLGSQYSFREISKKSRVLQQREKGVAQAMWRSACTHKHVERQRHDCYLAVDSWAGVAGCGGNDHKRNRRQSCHRVWKVGSRDAKGHPSRAVLSLRCVFRRLGLNRFWRHKSIEDRRFFLLEQFHVKGFGDEPHCGLPVARHLVVHGQRVVLGGAPSWVLIPPGGALGGGPCSSFHGSLWGLYLACAASTRWPAAGHCALSSAF